MGPTITLTRKQQGLGPNVDGRMLAQIRNVEVLVGIPQAAATRRGEPINNAEIMYIQTHGSPARGIPPRPVIEPAILAHQKEITAELKEAAAAWMQRNPDEALKYLKRAGIAGMNASKDWFTDPRNGWAPNAPSTIRSKGSSRPLIDTGELRKSITYVIRNAPVMTSAERLKADNDKKAANP